MGLNSFPKPSTAEKGPKNRLRKLLEELPPGSTESGQLTEIVANFYSEWIEKNFERLGNRDESIPAEKFTQTEHQEGHDYVDSIDIPRIRDVIKERIRLAEEDMGDSTQTEEYRNEMKMYKMALEKLRKLAAPY